LCAAAALSLARRSGWRRNFRRQDIRRQGRGKTLDRDAINKAIDARRAAAAEPVYLPAGIYVHGSIGLRSNITCSSNMDVIEHRPM